tara:strand:- start:271 stop:507 length:237 start_codon:yes stop_codon:yes gene_type:complete
MQNASWQRMGKAWKLEDRYSVIYCKKIKSKYELITANKNPLPNQSPWMSLGRYKTLTEAQQQGILLTSFPNNYEKKGE